MMGSPQHCSNSRKQMRHLQCRCHAEAGQAVLGCPRVPVLPQHSRRSACAGRCTAVNCMLSRSQWRRGQLAGTCLCVRATLSRAASAAVHRPMLPTASVLPQSSLSSRPFHL